MSDTFEYGITVTYYGNGTTTYTPRCACGWSGPERPRRKAADADATAHHKRDHQ